MARRLTTVRVPLRITLGGGGSDLVNGHGVCLSATIDKTISVTVTPTWEPRYVLHYSQYENVRRTDEIRHRIIREVFERFDVPPGIQVSSIAEIPAGTGLGSSGAFTAGLIKALFPEMSRPELVRHACELDIGQQDQWSAVYGGVNVFDFAARTVRPVATSLGPQLQLFYTGIRHDSAKVLTGRPLDAGIAVDQALEARHALEQNDIGWLGQCFSSQWAAKLKRAHTEIHHRVAEWIAEGVERGAYGGKLIGAGDGGFLLFAGRTAVAGLAELPFALTDDGARCV